MSRNMWIIIGSVIVSALLGIGLLMWAYSGGEPEKTQTTVVEKSDEISTKDDFDQLRKVVNRLEDKVTVLQNKVVELQQENASLKQENASLRKRLGGTGEKSLEDQVADLRSDLAKMQTSVNDLIHWQDCYDNYFRGIWEPMALVEEDGKSVKKPAFEKVIKTFRIGPSIVTPKTVAVVPTQFWNDYLKTKAKDPTFVFEGVTITLNPDRVSYNVEVGGVVVAEKAKSKVKDSVVLLEEVE